MHPAGALSSPAGLAARLLNYAVHRAQTCRHIQLTLELGEYTREDLGFLIDYLESIAGIVADNEVYYDAISDFIYECGLSSRIDPLLHSVLTHLSISRRDL